MIVVPLDEGEPAAPALVLVVVLHSGAPGEGSSNMEVASNGLSWCNPGWFLPYMNFPAKQWKNNFSSLSKD